MTKISVLLCFVIVGCGVVTNGNEEEGGIYELKKGDFSVKLTNFGARIMSVVVPDKQGKLADVVLGYDSIEQYKKDRNYFGAIVGRVANRIGGANFTLDGTFYKLKNNSGINILHGGKNGFSNVFWKVEKYVKDGEFPSITLSYQSPDGDEGFPGELLVNVTYGLIGTNKLSVHMKGKSINKATPVNLAQHTYWNLGGHDTGDILSSEVQIFGSHVTSTVHDIPTGDISPVKGTPYNFLRPQNIGSQIKKLVSEKGYDINYVVDRYNPTLTNMMHRVAVVYHPTSGRVMKLLSNAPGMQFYTGNYVDKVKGKGGFVYQPHAGLCLETQGFPDAVNRPNFPSQIITPGNTYNHNMLYTFSTK